MAPRPSLWPRDAPHAFASIKLFPPKPVKCEPDGGRRVFRYRLGTAFQLRRDGMKHILGAVLLATLCITPAWADTRIGIVDMDQILKQSPQAVAAENELKKEFSSREQDIRNMMQRSRDLQAQLQKDELTMSESELDDRQSDLADLNRKIERSQREFREDLSQRKNEQFNVVMKQAQKAIRAIALKDKYDIILDNAVYAGKRVDITDQVLKEMEK
jgi:outer membrane protein